MNIGIFVYDRATDSFSGDIATLHFQFGPVEIKPTQKKNPNGPDYRLTSDTAHGHVELGAGWKRKSEKGLEFVSIELDAPLLEAPLHVRLFPSENGKTAVMVWNRAKAEVGNKADLKKAA